MLSRYRFSLAWKRFHLKGLKHSNVISLSLLNLFEVFWVALKATLFNLFFFFFFLGCKAVFLLLDIVLHWTKTIATNGETIVALHLGEPYETEMLFYRTDGRAIAASTSNMSKHRVHVGRRLHCMWFYEGFSIWAREGRKSTRAVREGCI